MLLTTFRYFVIIIYIYNAYNAGSLSIIGLSERMLIMNKQSKLSKGTWFNIILFGFVGQIAWAVENNFFNVFLFNNVGGTVNDISTMVAASAATAVITTFIMGALSDKIGKRKILLTLGYIIWGLSVGVFAFINHNNIASLFGIKDQAAVITATVTAVIVMDCVMTFFGSTSNDAAYSAWVTDVTNKHNRGTVESVLTLLPVFALVIVTVGLGLLTDVLAYSFIGLGAMVILCGVIGIFTLKDPENIQKSNDNYFYDLTYGFRPSVIKQNKQLYIALTAACFFNAAVQCWMPYIFIYLEHFMNFSLDSLNLSPKFLGIGAVAVVGVVVGIIALGKLVDKLGKDKFVFISALLFVIGLVWAGFAKTMGMFGIAALFFLAGYGLMMINLNAAVRDFMPEGKSGRFQGVRMIFVVLLPMLIGPKLGAAVIEHFSAGLNYTNEYGQIIAVPVPQMFFAAAVLAVLIFIPLFMLRKDLKKAD